LESLTGPVRLGCVCRAKILQKDHSFWISPQRKPYSEDYKLKLVEWILLWVANVKLVIYTIFQMTDESKRWIIMNRFSLHSVSSNFSDVIHSLSSQTVDPTFKPTSPTNGDSGSVKDDSISAEIDPGDDGTDDDEPLMSGNGGEDLKIITDDDAFVAWGDLVTEWREWNKGSGKNALSLPPHPSAKTVVTQSGAECLPNGALGRRIRQLVRLGIPDTLRPEIWHRMTGYQAVDQGLAEVYRIMLTKPCELDEAIQKDLPRTLPAHNFFQEKTGQEVLFQLIRAYALYDEPVGYCQGISFIAAALLLHLPEEQAFCLLVKIMSNYGIRMMFLNNCEGLLRCLHQLDRLIEDQVPDVYRAFSELGIKSHMYASQWFLTLFTAKFPLNFVFRIFDIFLVEGLLFIFKVMIAFLKISRNYLLGLDFEGTLKYFRITLPKRFRSNEACDEFISTACSIKISGRQLIRYGRDFEKQREVDAKANSESAALVRELNRLREECGRLDKENGDLAGNLMAHKTDMQSTIDRLEDEVENLRQELRNTQYELKEREEECALLERDSSLVKEMLRKALSSDQAKGDLLSKYQTANANLSARLEKEQNTASQKLSQIVVEAVLGCNGECRRVLDERSPGWAIDAECSRQDLGHQLTQTLAELNELKSQAEAGFGYNPRQWLAKKWTNVSSRANGNSSSTPNTAIPPDSTNLEGSNYSVSTFAESPTTLN
uniref:Rab-GAP TBC domain-containing protein n=1 Tax=Rodentolepis nana TaxID=102285 RepID=A0A158QIB5_RODNA